MSELLISNFSGEVSDIIPDKEVKTDYSDNGQPSNPKGQENNTTSPEASYPGDYIDSDGPLKGEYQTLDFPDPALFLAFYDRAIANGTVTLHKWQTEFHEECAAAKADSQHPLRYCLLTCNGSGKDAFIIAGWSVWFCASKIRARVIITSASGVQLTGQTENYIASLCRKVNEFHGCEVFRIRQRYIKCMLSGSEIRLFATDEAGKAEGYHPLEPNAEMTIIVNEAKSVVPEIHGALRRCTGFNYWFEISSAGEPSGDFYKAYTNWKYTNRVTAYDCPHISKDEIEQAKIDLGESSALYRSIYLALFTSLSGETVIPQKLIEDLLSLFNREKPEHVSLKEDRVGIDLAAGGDENTIFKCNGNKCLKEVFFREVDTEIAAQRIDKELKDMGISKTHKYIFADDGGVGRAIIDKLVHMGWTINRVLNQSPAVSKKLYGNKGAENWYRFSRILEERFFDITTVSPLCREQLYTRHYKKTNTSGRLFLESKKEAKAEGRPSPDRADGLILAYTGITIDEFLSLDRPDKSKIDNRPKEKFISMNDAYEHYENSVTYENYDPNKKQPTSTGRIKGSLSVAMRH